MKRNFYAYMIFGAIVVAGLAGYMISEQSSPVEIILEKTGSYDITVDVISGDSSVSDPITEEANNYGEEENK